MVNMGYANDNAHDAIMEIMQLIPHISRCLNTFKFRSFRTNVTRALAEIKKSIPATFQIFSIHPVDNYYAKKNISYL